MINKLLFAVAASALIAFGANAYADNYPSRTIVMVAPLSVGGSTGIINSRKN